LTNGQLVIVPAGREHGFSNTGQTTLHIESTLAAPVFEAAYDDKRESPRRWLPGEQVR
jgi:mannose-6-phosphate isomerase-like protein (cupin superfamily)